MSLVILDHALSVNLDYVLVIRKSYIYELIDDNHSSCSYHGDEHFHFTCKSRGLTFRCGFNVETLLFSKSDPSLYLFNFCRFDLYTLACSS